MNVLKGIDIAPRYVSWARGLVAAVGIAIVEAIIKFTTDNSLSGNWDVYLPVLLLVLRAVEGEIDQWRTPAQNTTQPSAPTTPPTA